MIDVGKLLSQLSRSEKARSDIESQLAESIKSLNEVKEVSTKHSASKEKLQTELKDLKKRLRSNEDEMKKLESENAKFLSTLKDFQTKILTVVGSNPAEETEASTSLNGKPEHNSS